MSSRKRVHPAQTMVRASSHTSISSPSILQICLCGKTPRCRSPLLRCLFRKIFVITTLLFLTTTTVMLLQNTSLDPSQNAIHPPIRDTRQNGANSDLHVQGPDAIFKPKDLKNKGPQGNQKVALASDAMPQKHKLLEMQQEIIERQKRPPDSAYNINVTLSDSISLDRAIEDTRPDKCKSFVYNHSKLPKVSIIIPFYNEAVSMLLRTIHSILNRTPDQLLEEIVLIDDESSHESLQAPLDRYVKLLPKVKLLRNAGREGLIRSRMRGADAARADFLVFLDAHTEVNAGWLEPILVELLKHPNTIVQPFVDGIDIQSLTYSRPSKIFKGSFSWDLRYVWIKLPEHVEKAAWEDGVPYWSSTLVGCAIAVNKTYFYKIGAFDTDQKIWGGENIELAFRVWMCGGTVKTLPCSRVGHVFRPLPYSIDDGWQNPWQRNLMRVADVWMDDYKKYFYSSTRIYENRRVNYTIDEYKSLKKRKELRRRLQCQNFSWYLTNVAPEIPIPPHDARMYGEITNYQSQACWQVTDDSFIVSTYQCYEHKLIAENIFTLSHTGLLLYKNRCVQFMFPKPALKVVECPDVPSNSIGIWHLRYKGQKRWAQIVVTLKVNGKPHDWCVMQVTSAVDVHKGNQMPQAAACEDDNMFQFWAFSYRFDYKD